MAEDILIGVTGAAHGLPWGWWATRWRLRRLGVQARHLTAAGDYPGEHFAGFVIGGGNDIDPAIYGGDPAHSPNVDTVRDEYELAVLDLADRIGAPVLGICRGAQLLNVHFGGTLHGDISSQRVTTSNRATLWPRKAVTVREDSRLAGFLGRLNSRVNSLHHQAVDRPGRNLTVSAWDNDGIVQGIENQRGPLRVGVQWHPEYLPQRRDQRRLFASFVDVCRAYWRAREHEG